MAYQLRELWCYLSRRGFVTPALWETALAPLRREGGCKTCEEAAARLRKAGGAPPPLRPRLRAASNKRHALNAAPKDPATHGEMSMFDLWLIEQVLSGRSLSWIAYRAGMAETGARAHLKHLLQALGSDDPRTEKLRKRLN
jgi:DNA-binding CsgD family transcriptional regulator